MNYIICHYGEIALKGKNRKFFEEQLVGNIKLAIGRGNFEYVKRISGRIIIKIQNPKSKIQNLKYIDGKLSKVFGISNFAFAVSCSPRQSIDWRGKQDIEVMKKTALEILRPKKFKTFKISTRRAQKSFPLTSQRINEEVGAYIVKKLKKQVKLDNPEATCFIEIAEKYAFLYTEKIKGLGGLPVGVSGRAVALLSGGIDSSVAGWYAMKRGLRVIFAHFHAYPYTNKASIEKAKKLAHILAQFQYNAKLYLVPFGEIQKEILLKTPAKLRVVLYRRFMVRIADQICKKEKAQALVTGENLGQVASQTIQNMAVIEKAAKLPILRPLVGFDKEEIISKAREIGTFDISILPDQDCCTRFVPKRPATKAKIDEVRATEQKIRIRKLVFDAVRASECRTPTADE